MQGERRRGRGAAGGQGQCAAAPGGSASSSGPATSSAMASWARSSAASAVCRSTSGTETLDGPRARRSSVSSAPVRSSRRRRSRSNNRRPWPGHRAVSMHPHGILAEGLLSTASLRRTLHGPPGPRRPGPALLHRLRDDRLPEGRRRMIWAAFPGEALLPLARREDPWICPVGAEDVLEVIGGASFHAAWHHYSPLKCLGAVSFEKKTERQSTQNASVDGSQLRRPGCAWTFCSYSTGRANRILSPASRRRRGFFRVLTGRNFDVAAAAGKRICHEDAFSVSQQTARGESSFLWASSRSASALSSKHPMASRDGRLGRRLFRCAGPPKETTPRRHGSYDPDAA